MKKLMFLGLLFLSVISLNAQNSVSLHFSDTYTGENLDFLYGHRFDNHEISAGVKYLLQPKSVPQSLLMKHYYPSNFKQSIGFEAAYCYYFWNPGKLNAGAFYDFQYTNSDFVDDNMNVITSAQGLENNVGLKISYNLFGNLDIEAQSGIGLIRNIFSNSESAVIAGGDWDYSHLLRVGMKYRF